jgi:hypothetical protein
MGAVDEEEEERKRKKTWLPLIETHWMSYSRGPSIFLYPILCYVPFHSRKGEKEQMGEGYISQVLQDGERRIRLKEVSDRYRT